jgi:DNA-binding beta-propeller fold protein YncE
VWVIAKRKIVARVGGFVQQGGLAGIGDQVAAVDVGGDTVTLIDANTLRRQDTAPAGAGPTHVVGGPPAHAYVIDTRGNAVLTFETKPRLRQIGRLKLAGTPYGVAIDTARHRLWVTLTATNQLVELAATATVIRVIATFPTGQQPNTVAVDPIDGRVFVANAGNGTVELIDPRR